MYPVTETFLEVLRSGSIKPAATAEVYYADQFVTSVPIASGSVTIDRTSDTRRSCTFTVADASFVPAFVNSPLAPYGAEVVLKAGLSYEDGTEELCQLGVFRIQDVTWEEAGGSLPTVTGFDRSKVMQDAKFLYPRDLSGKSAFTLLSHEGGFFPPKLSKAAIIIDTFNLTDYNLPGGSIADSDRWGFLQTVCQAMGAEAYFDVNGNMQITPVPALTQAQINSGAEVWEVDAGPTGVLVNASRGVSRTDVYNAVAITGASGNSGPSPMGFWADFDPRSPTYWGPPSAMPYGPYTLTPFGEVVLRKSNNLCTTAAQCKIAAQAELNNALGLARSLSFETVWNPALQDADIVKVTYLDGTSELHIIDKLTISLKGDEKMTADTRTLTYQSTANT